MKLVKIITQSRRDFQGKYICEFCGYEETDKGMLSYDDRNYHDNVIPNIECPKCGKSTNSEGGPINYTKIKYHEGFEI